MDERDIFTNALALLGSDARRQYIATACAGDEGLRRRVEILLHAHEGARHFLEQPIFADAGNLTQAAPADATMATSAEPGNSDDEDEETNLDFLQPSTRPGSLGRLSHYEVLEVLGRGGFGTVVKAFDEKLHRMVAIKIMARGLAATSPARKRFLREARAAAAIRHENVVNIYAVDEQPIPYLVMEYIAGPTLQEKLDEIGPIEIPEVLRIGAQIADGLAAAHRQGLIHRDIKPGNILLEAMAERVKITDFGLARAADDASLTQSGVIAGTPLYMSPEQALGATIDQRADLFSLGSVLYVMCTGRPPFRAPSTLAVLRRVAEDAPRPIHEIIPEVPADLADLINRLHAKDPAARFTSAEAVADALRARITTQSSPRSRPPVAPPATAARAKPVALDSELLVVSHSAAAVRPVAREPWYASSRFWTLVAALIIALVVVEAAGISDFRGAVARLVASEGILVVHVQPDNPRAEVVIIGENGVITGPMGQRDWDYHLKPGQYQIVLREGYDRVLKRQTVTIRRNETQQIWLDANLPDPTSAIATAPPAAPVSGLGSWGQWIDPMGGSRASRDGDQLTIAIPGDSHRHLNPLPGFNLDAPRVLQATTGDFSIQVQVPPFPAPTIAADTDRARKDDGYRWAGLVVWVNERNFLRFGVGKHPEFDKGRPFLDFKLHRDLKMAGEEVHYTTDATTYFRIDRRGDTIYLKTSTDGQDWTDSQNASIVGFPAKVFVGVGAINSGTREFAPRFASWSLRSIGSAYPEAGGEATAINHTTELGSWGQLVDPVGGVRVLRSGDRLAIAMPTNSPRDFNPERDLNAPRVVQTTQGDWVAQVKVLPSPRPYFDPNAGGHAFHLAGLTVGAGDREFLRFGVSSHSEYDGGKPLVEFKAYRDSKPSAQETRDAGNGPNYLQVECRGGTLTMRTSADGSNWSFFKDYPLGNQAAPVSVGVIAINSGRSGFTPEFEGWSLRALNPVTTADLGLWGQFEDPTRKCRATQTGSGLTLAVPADLGCDLNPRRGFSLDAPRAFQDAEGDFAIQVQVLPFGEPGESGSNTNGVVYRWAGLIVWASESQFVRFGYAEFPGGQDKRPFTDLEFFRSPTVWGDDLRHADSPPNYFRAERRGTLLVLQTSFDGRTWNDYKTVSILSYPAKLRIGVAAIKTGAKPFTPRFDGLKREPADLGPWGKLIDPMGGVQVTQDQGRLTMAMPQDTPTDLNPAPGKNLNAPRLLQNVDGDFTVQVQLLPFTKPVFDQEAPQQTHTYQFEGLLLWASESDFLRVGISRNTEHEKGEALLNVESFRDLVANLGDLRFAGDGSTFIQAERRGNILTLKTSNNGREWSDYATQDLTGMPTRISVGVTAINTGRKPFAPQFANWSLRPIAPAVPR